MRRLVVAITLSAVASVHVAPALANPQKARQHFQLASRYFDTGDFDKAIEEFRAAYALHPLPELLFNIAQSHRLAGRCRQAVLAYESYLRKDPEGNRSKDAKDWIGELGSCDGDRPGATTAPAAPPTKPAPPTTKPALATTKPAPPARGPQGAPRVDAQPAPSPVDPTPSPAVPPPAVAVVPAEPAPPAPVVGEASLVDDDESSPGRGQRIGGLATAGVGAVLLGTGLVFAMKARSDASTVEEAMGEWDAELEDIQARGQRNGKLALVFSGVGAAALVGGGVLYYLGHRAGSEEHAVSVVPAADGGWVVWQGSY